MADLIKNELSYTVATQPGWFVGALKRANTLNHDYVRVIPNVTKDALVKKLVLAGNTVSQKDARDCAWTPSQRITADGKTMSVANFKINEEQCMDALDSIYSEEVFRTQTSQGADKKELPADFGEAVMYLVGNGLSSDVDRIIWGGASNAVDGVQDGLIDKATASSSVVKVAAATITVANVLEEIQKVYDAIPDRVIEESIFDPEKAPVRIFVGSKVYRYMQQALAGVSSTVIYPSWTTNGGTFRYMNVEVALIPFMPENTMMAFSRDNAAFVTDLLSDTTSIDAERGQSLKDNNTYYIKGKYRAGADFIFDDEVVLYA